jgi:hypothetical protein
MAKKKAEKPADAAEATDKVAAPQVEGPKKHLIEMTADEGREFQEFRELQERNKKIAEEKAKKGAEVLLNLGFQHRRNGKKFGPGMTRVPEEFAGSLEAADTQALRAKLRENQTDEHLFEVVARGQQRRIK